MLHENIIGDGIASAVGDQTGKFAQQLWDGQNSMFSSFFTGWVSSPPTELLGG